MKFNIYCLFDTKTAAYNTPVFVINDAVAKRAALDALKNNPQIAAHPEDFCLFKLGTFEDNTAEFDLLPTPTVMFRFHELLIPDSVIDNPPGSASDYDDRGNTTLKRVSKLENT